MKATPSLLRMASTHHGMRRILKRPIPAIDFIRKAVLAGVYKTEKKKAPKDGERRDNREQEEVKFTLPPEYEILVLNPPIPMPARTPTRILRQEAHQAAMEDKTNRLVKKYLANHDSQDNADPSVDDYYRKLLGIPPPPRSSSMGQKSTLLNKAYAVALKQQELLRRNSALTESESLQLVEDLLQEESKNERVHSRKVQQNIREWKHHDSKVENVPPRKNNRAANLDDGTSDESNVDDATSSPSVLHSKPRTIQGIAIWSKKLEAVPYRQWTLGASVALDHFIAASILDVSDETWDALLEGSDPSLKSIAQDIVTTRHTLFPETVPLKDRVDKPAAVDAFVDEETREMEASIDELLASLGGFDDDEVVVEDVPDVSGTPGNIQELREDLQTWRAKQMASDFDSWAPADQTRFNSWLKGYVETLQGDDVDGIDWVATRDALLAIPPTSEDESKEFWDSIRDQTQAEIFLENLSPSGEGDSLLPFWNLSHSERVRRLTALGALRPILDEYADPNHRRAFLERHTDKLLEGLPLEHIVNDPKGPISGADLRKMSGAQDVDDSDHFSIQDLPYESDEKSRVMLTEWNIYKSNRARYEELLFKKGRMGLRYRDGIKGRKKSK